MIMKKHFPWFSSDNQTHFKVCALVSIYSPLRRLVMGPSPSPHTSICPAHVFGLALKEREGTSENSNIKECFKPLDDLFFYTFLRNIVFPSEYPQQQSATLRPPKSGPNHPLNRSKHIMKETQADKNYWNLKPVTHRNSLLMSIVFY